MRKKAMALCMVLLLWSSTVAVAAAVPETLIPVGKTVGISLETDGVVVVGFDENGSTAKDAGVKKGDIITEINGQTVDSAQGLQSAILAEDTVEVTLMRGDDDVEIHVANGGEKLGIQVREGISGIGTVTFYDPATDTYGALGHGVNEPDARILLPLDSGELCPSKVVDVEQGTAGRAGLLRGAFETNKILGTVEQNTDHGIFGQGAYELATRQAVPVAEFEEVTAGNATILSNVDGETVVEYQVKILQTADQPKENGRDMVVEITDPRLLNITGGIVQGMSGSPILQNGKLIGAVTHVFVNDPHMGYGIYIGNMIETVAETNS
ncbi:MAG: SpoIVB peptidase S55 domain-containing protein [Eubacteriales bacterium]